MGVNKLKFYNEGVKNENIILDLDE